MTPNDEPSPLTEEQLQLLFATIRKVSTCGWGRITIVVENGHPRFIEHQFSVDLARLEKWDKLESSH